jgi:hypothetical protein
MYENCCFRYNFVDYMMIKQGHRIPMNIQSLDIYGGGLFALVYDDLNKKFQLFYNRKTFIG